jgi:CDP-glucose 4,6-dehydratase
VGEWKGTLEDLVVTRQFWRDRRVLVTGHTGFKGAWLCHWLGVLGAKASGVALEATRPSLFALSSLAGSMRSTIADIRDLAALRRIFADTQPEVVFHMAAQSLVRAGYEDPVDTYSTNVLGTVHVLEAVRATPSVKAAVVVTSDKCYENREWVWGYRESDPMGGHDPYSSSKGCAEIVTAAYRRSFFSDPARAGTAGGPVGATPAQASGAQAYASIASARAGNVIGGGDWARDRLVPDLISAFGRKEPARIRHPNAIRPWQHVLEPLSGYLTLAEALSRAGQVYAEAWNFGPGEDDTRSVAEVATRLTQAWGGDASWEPAGMPNASQPAGSEPHEAQQLRLDCAKARQRLGWKPRLDLAQALQWTVDWHRAVGEGADARVVTEAQIARYQEL